MRTERAGLARSLAPSLAVAVSTLLVALVVTALGWQEIVDEYDRSVADQLALDSRAIAQGLAHRCQAAGTVLNALDGGVPRDHCFESWPRDVIPDGALLAEWRQGRFTLAQALSPCKELPGALARWSPIGRPGRSAAIVREARLWLVIQDATSTGPIRLLAQPLDSLLDWPVGTRHLRKTVTIERGEADQAKPVRRHGEVIGGGSSVALCGETWQVLVSVDRAQASGRALRRFTRFCLALALPLLACIGLLGVIAGRAVVATRAEQRRAHERQALHEISEALLSALTTREVLQCIVDRARAIFGAAGASLALVDAPSGELRFEVASAANAASADALVGARLPADNGLAAWAVARQQAALRSSASPDGPPAPDARELLGGDADSAMAAPLFDEAQRCVGALTLTAAVGRPFVDADLVLLRSLAVTAALAMARATAAERQREQARIANELDIARTVQRSLLPGLPLETGTISLAGAGQPAHEVGGDFYDYHDLGDGRVAFIIADVADKGLGAAMFMVVCRSLYYASGAGRRQPAETLAELNTRLVAMNTSNLFVTVFHGVIDASSGRVDYACAGHLPPVLWRQRDQQATLLSERGMALGVIDDAPIGGGSVTLSAGDSLLLYTDGITDALDASDVAFGTDRLLRAVGAASAVDAPALVSSLLAEVTAFVGSAPQFDDTTLLAVCCRDVDTGVIRASQSA